MPCDRLIRELLGIDARKIHIGHIDGHKACLFEGLGRQTVLRPIENQCRKRLNAQRNAKFGKLIVDGYLVGVLFEALAVCIKDLCGFGDKVIVRIFVFGL